MKKEKVDFEKHKKDVKKYYLTESIFCGFTQILCNCMELADILKPFFENLNHENINDDKYIPLLKTFSIYQLTVLCNNNIISKQKATFLITNKENYKPLNSGSHKEEIDEIISDDNVKELQELFLVKESFKDYTFSRSFNEVEHMTIPLLQYCIIKRSFNCFKYLLVNGYGNPKESMKEDCDSFSGEDLIYQNRYNWDCMAIAIYFGCKDIIKILEEKCFEKGNIPSHIEAATLSYRNEILNEMLTEMNKTNENIKQILKQGLLASSKNNNIKGAELLFEKGAELLARKGSELLTGKEAELFIKKRLNNYGATRSHLIKTIQLYFILQHLIIQLRC